MEGTDGLTGPAFCTKSTDGLLGFLPASLHCWFQLCPVCCAFHRVIQQRLHGACRFFGCGNGSHQYNKKGCLLCGHRAALYLPPLFRLWSASLQQTWWRISHHTQVQKSFRSTKEICSSKCYPLHTTAIVTSWRTVICPHMGLWFWKLLWGVE